jgi:hypothetical protein
MSHTPAPWFLNTRTSTCDGVSVSWSIDSDTRVSIANGQAQEHLGPESGIFRTECIANAQLIAAAPDLLYVLRNLVQLEADGRTERESSIEYWEAARAAIAKATGDAQ